jgi:HSP20 family protein
MLYLVFAEPPLLVMIALAAAFDFCPRIAKNAPNRRGTSAASSAVIWPACPLHERTGGISLAGSARFSLERNFMTQPPRRFGDLLLAAARSFQQTSWQPAVDVYRTRDGWLLKYELAGVAPGDVEVVLHGRTVTVRGVRRDVRIEDNQQSYCMEISYNQFERSLELPCEVDMLSAATQYRDGMLLVRLSCQEDAP